MPDEKDDDEFDEKFTKKFNELFHKASKEREDRFEKKLSKNIEGLFTAFTEKLPELLPKPEKKEEPAPGQPKPDGTVKLSAEHEAMIKQSQKDAKEAKDMAEKYKREAEAEKQKNLRAEERQLLVTSLGQKVKPQLLDMVVDQLHTKNITRDPESGRILWKNADGEIVPFTDGVDSWAKSDFGKEVAPPKQVNGAGSRGGSSGDERVKPGEMTLDALGGIIAGSIPGSR